jgi:hypothetical protein
VVANHELCRRTDDVATLKATWIAVAWGNELRRASTAATPADSTRTSTGSGSKRNNTKCNTTSNNNNINNSGGGGSSSSSDQHTHRTRLARATLVCCFLTFLPEVLLYMGSRAIAPPANGAELIPLVVEGMGCTVRVFRQKFTIEDAIGSHACLLEVNMRVPMAFLSVVRSSCRLTL